MDVSAFAQQAAYQLVAQYWFIIPFFILAGLLKSPWFKGVLGEFIVNVAARMMLDRTQYHLVRDVTLPTQDGTTQIDHIIVSVYGVFVVETKNMRGWIFGSADQGTWTQKIYKHSTKFQSPLRQNYKHVKVLQELLGLGDREVFSVVAFVGNSTFKTAMPEHVTGGLGYIHYIKGKTEEVLTEEQVVDMLRQIETGRYPCSLKTHREHVRHVKGIVAAKADTPVCPKCGSAMVQRTGRKGEIAGKSFWGCSRYPRCRAVVV